MQASHQMAAQISVGQPTAIPMQSPSFADAFAQEALHRPLHNSRIIQSTSFGDSSFTHWPSQGSYAYSGTSQWPPAYTAGYAAPNASGYAGSSTSAGWNARCAEVYRAPQQVIPSQHSVSMYVQR